jgi:hypothetical protein
VNNSPSCLVPPLPILPQTINSLHITSILTETTNNPQTIFHLHHYYDQTCPISKYQVLSISPDSIQKSSSTKSIQPTLPITFSNTTASTLPENETHLPPPFHPLHPPHSPYTRLLGSTHRRTRRHHRSTNRSTWYSRLHCPTQQPMSFRQPH